VRCAHTVGDLAAPDAAQVAAAAVLRTPEFAALCEKLQRHAAAAVHGHLSNEIHSLEASRCDSGRAVGALVVVRLRLPASLRNSLLERSASHGPAANDGLMTYGMGFRAHCRHSHTVRRCW
jgi:hypothetical protein